MRSSNASRSLGEMGVGAHETLLHYYLKEWVSSQHVKDSVEI